MSAATPTTGLEAGKRKRVQTGLNDAMLWNADAAPLIPQANSRSTALVNIAVFAPAMTSISTTAIVKKPANQWLLSCGKYVGRSGSSFASSFVLSAVLHRFSQSECGNARFPKINRGCTPAGCVHEQELAAEDAHCA